MLPIQGRQQDAAEPLFNLDGNHDHTLEMAFLQARSLIGNSMNLIRRIHVIINFTVTNGVQGRGNVHGSSPPGERISRASVSGQY